MNSGAGAVGNELLWDRTSLVRRFYDLLQLLPRLDFTAAREELPENGLYVFFERGEMVEHRGVLVDRVVRVGTHREDDRFPAGIRLHFRGNRSASPFRRHIGGALLRRTRIGGLQDWIRQDGPAMQELEEMVSRELRAHFKFSCFPVDERNARQSLEKGLIGLLANSPLAWSSPTWLGRDAA
ncbi:MAG: hypothetical protein Q7O66_11315, partial [Dehalococcoidia bacterium]|nr:hypothetical protein [Dehalococcoidia bacterium]